MSFMRFGLFAISFWALLACAGLSDRDKDGIQDKLDECPMSSEDLDGFEDVDGCPDLDNDKDGVPDSKDRCPLEAEDRDGFLDEDGCSDLDNDNDNIPDLIDKCPFDAEDMDGFEDKDGCPESDNDKDGIADALDKCPIQAEDKDNFEDLDGCPELDNDKDGIADLADVCPNDPETMNGLDDQDGCPDQIVDPFPEQIELNIRFVEGGAELTEEDKALLKKHIVPGLVAFPADRVYMYIFMPFDGVDTTSYLDVLNRRTQSIDTYLQSVGVSSRQIRKRTITLELYLSQIGSHIDLNANRPITFRRKTF